MSLCLGVQSAGSRGQSMISLTGSSDQVYMRPVKYTPDFTVKAMSDLLYLRIRRPHYVAALRATLLERTPKNADDGMEDAFSKEWKRAISVPDPDHPKVTLGSTVDVLGSPEIQSGETISSASPSTAEQDGLIPDGRTRSDTQESLDGDRSADAGTPLIISSCETMPDSKNEVKS